MSNLMPYRYTRHPAPRNDLRIFDDFFRPFFMGSDAYADAFRVDVSDQGDHFLLEADLPGMKREDVHIDVEENVLTISAEVNQCRDESREHYVYNERRCGKFQRSFTLNGIDETQISAEYVDGVLKLKMPKLAQETKNSRQIPIQ